MEESTYHVRVNRSEGSVEIVGPDKEWVAEQLDRLMPVMVSASGAADRTRTHGSADGSETSEPLSGGVTEASNGKSRRARRSGGSGTLPKANPTLAAKLTDEVRTKLSAYLEERKAKAKDAQTEAAVIATFLLDELGWTEVTGDDLFTVYSEMGWKIPATRSALGNAQKRKGYFTAPNEGKYKVSHTGQNFARHDSKG